jgi:hypothetical protein
MQAHDGRIAVIQFHGVPEGEHDHVNTPRDKFEEFMAFLHEHDFTVIACRDLARYVDPRVVPVDACAAINARIEGQKQKPKGEPQNK